MSAANPALVRPPDDTGSETFARFKYQAKVVFPYILQCALDESLIAVIPEHIEDLCLQYNSRWRFLQIKTRDPRKGMWTLSDLTADDGALHSLYRSYKATKDCHGTYELHLEQPVSPHSSIGEFRTEQAHRNQEIVSSVRMALGIPKKECTNFLGRVRLADPLPPRAHVDAVNVRLAASVAQNLSLGAIESIYASCLQRIELAMMGEQLGVAWPVAVIDPELTADVRFQAKRIDRAEARKLVSDLLNGSLRLLRRTLRQDLPPPTNLEAKLIAGGASEEVIEDAKMLRAYAATAQFEYLERAGHNSNALTDLQERLLLRMRGIRAGVTSSSPAPIIWGRLHTEFHHNPDALDPNNVFNRDPMLLIGGVCELSDRCLVDWMRRA